MVMISRSFEDTKQGYSISYDVKGDTYTLDVTEDLNTDTQKSVSIELTETQFTRLMSDLGHIRHQS